MTPYCFTARICCIVAVIVAILMLKNQLYFLFVITLYLFIINSNYLGYSVFSVIKQVSSSKIFLGGLTIKRVYLVGFNFDNFLSFWGSKKRGDKGAKVLLLLLNLVNILSIFKKGGIVIQYYCCGRFRAVLYFYISKYIKLLLFYCGFLRLFCSVEEVYSFLLHTIGVHWRLRKITYIINTAADIERPLTYQHRFEVETRSLKASRPIFTEASVRDPWFLYGITSTKVSQHYLQYLFHF